MTKGLELVFERKLARGMPAHLHIDILPEAQRQGIGHRLMNALMFRLKELGVPKVYLVVGTSNVKGVSFYEKYGFEAVRELPGSRQYAIDVEEKCAELESRGVASEAERSSPKPIKRYRKTNGNEKNKPPLSLRRLSIILLTRKSVKLF